MDICKSFSPQINKKSEILILGSMPGIKSLKQHQYYAHPQNRFWKLMGIICNCKNLAELNYETRIKVLLANRFALWDVFETCQRKGSLDTNIKEECPNNIPALLEEHSSIKIICLNGSKSYSAFKKYFPDLLKNHKCLKLPSTSPANARFKLEDLYEHWSSVLKLN